MNTVYFYYFIIKRMNKNDKRSRHNNGTNGER